MQRRHRGRNLHSRTAGLPQHLFARKTHEFQMKRTLIKCTSVLIFVGGTRGTLFPPSLPSLPSLNFSIPSLPSLPSFPLSLSLSLPSCDRTRSLLLTHNRLSVYMRTHIYVRAHEQRGRERRGGAGLRVRGGVGRWRERFYQDPDVDKPARCVWCGRGWTDLADTIWSHHAPVYGIYEIYRSER